MAATKTILHRATGKQLQEGNCFHEEMNSTMGSGVMEELSQGLEYHLGQWFATFLMPRPFAPVPRVGDPQPSGYFIAIS